ncbi:MAG TPA: lysozyme inhibitor LprI family protein [Acidimicrobiales bacterium]|nr:lysozyme inhibitor LprI family protein [Acidimicrobiales bacterium]
MPVVRFNQSCDKTAISQVAMDQCVASEVAEVQRQLDVALSELERGARKADVDMMSMAQTRFEAYENAECPGAVPGSSEGTIYPMLRGLCQLRLSVQRLQEVRQDALGVSGGH